MSTDSVDYPSGSESPQTITQSGMTGTNGANGVDTMFGGACSSFQGTKSLAGDFDRAIF